MAGDSFRASRNRAEAPAPLLPEETACAMIQILLLLCGSHLVRRKRRIIFLLGLTWFCTGVFLAYDAFDNELRIPPVYFTVPLLLDGLWAFFQSFSTTGTARTLRLAKAGMLLFVVLLIFTVPRHSGMIIGLLVGAFLVADAVWRGASAYVVRFEGWHAGAIYSVVEGFFGLWSMVPWPTYWEASIGYDVGVLMAFSATGICFLALRIRRLPPGRSILTVLNRGWPKPLDSNQEPDAVDSGEQLYEPGEAIVHVWTPTERLVSLNRGVSRYVAAPDAKGVVSTGHAALELPPDVYISHYPAMEIDRSRTDFVRILRGTPDNNVPGRFLPSYEEESADWCPSTMRVRLPGLNARAIRHFWREYRVDTTYNLTSRSCASAVAKALDAGIEGLFRARMSSPRFWFRLLSTPEMWVAGFMRQRAMAMAWTPGIVLDYARALSHIITLPDRRPS